MICSCGYRGVVPNNIWRSEGRCGYEIAIMGDCPKCKSTLTRPWGDVTELQRKAAHLAELSRDAASEITM